MIDDLIAHTRIAGESMLGIMTWPGEQVLTFVADVVPDTLDMLTLHPDNSPLLYAVSLLAWLLALWFVRAVVGFVRNAFRMFGRIGNFIRFRMSMAMTFGKRRVHSLSRAFRAWRHPEEVETPHVEFEERDIAVLDAVVSLGPGFAVSAPELTEQMGLRPAQIQQSLDKLCDSSLLQAVIGSTDGFGNYGVTPIGEAFLQSWFRQTAPKRPQARKTPQAKKTPEGFIPDGLHLRG